MSSHNLMLSRRQVVAGGLAMSALPKLSVGRPGFVSSCGGPEPISRDEARRRRFALSLFGPRKRVTRHNVMIRGERVDYTATVGAIVLTDAAAEPCATFVYTAYTRTGVSRAGERPIIFVWSGGPSGPASYLSFAVLGPRIRATDSAGHELEAPLRDNGDCVLDRSDIVMVDPVGTGYSTAAGKYRLWDFYSVEKDAASVAQFIKRYLEDSGRTQSPVYLLGESYGTIRLPVVITCLRASGVEVSGGVLIGSAADGNTLWTKPGHIEPYYLKFPNYAAIAWYHGRVPGARGSLESHYREAGDFALNAFLTALVAWPNLADARREAVVGKAYELTGIGREVWSSCRLRLSEAHFTQVLMGDPERKLRPDDARQLIPAHEKPAENFADTPTYIDRYYREELSVLRAPIYRRLAPGIYSSNDTAGPHPWDMTDHDAFADVDGLLVPGFPNYLVDIAAAMKANPRLRIQQHSGLYDLECSSFQANWGLERTDVPDALRANFQMFDYESGHAVYMNAPSEFEKFTRNLAGFFAT